VRPDLADGPALAQRRRGPLTGFEAIQDVGDLDAVLVDDPPARFLVKGVT
jgi:hypothetical protein